MNGFEMFGPVFTALSPGTWSTRASMILGSMVFDRVLEETATMAMGVSRSRVAPRTPVTMMVWRESTWFNAESWAQVKMGLAIRRSRSQRMRWGTDRGFVRLNAYSLVGIF